MSSSTHILKNEYLINQSIMMGSEFSGGARKLLHSYALAPAPAPTEVLLLMVINESDS